MVFSQIPDYTYQEYFERLQQPSGLNYFDRYQTEPLNDPQKSLSRSLDDDEETNSRHLYARSSEDTRDGIPVDLYVYFGINFTDILRSANKIEPVEIPNNNIDTQVYEFTKEYDDKQLR